MNFEQYMNPPILDNIMEQIEDEVAKKKTKEYAMF